MKFSFWYRTTVIFFVFVLKNRLTRGLGPERSFNICVLFPKRSTPNCRSDITSHHVQALNFLVEQDRLFQNTPDWGIDSFRLFWDKYSPLLLLPPLVVTCLWVASATTIPLFSNGSPGLGIWVPFLSFRSTFPLF